ncbi:hypothetical protein Patl1_02001 [Pistacia atlantica]|uniref:Uncharacterized protein n=1 Tax=Pistacia atlantica TaxID=434234 RepID=A0ACC1CAK0_9ROSI|nr:hypothetical protein Patl1_02001 [Pistacia atlantica]
MRFLMIVLKPLHQSRFSAELIASILIGPSALGGFTFWKFEALKWMNLFPFDHNMLLETFGNLGVTYYMFLVGLEMDLSNLKHTGKKSWSIAIAGILVPFCVGALLFFVPILRDMSRRPSATGAVFWAITLTITSFPDLARTLSDVKLLHTELGRTALTSSIITDISTWILLAMAITLFGESRQSIIFRTIPIISFGLFCYFALRPAIAWMIQRTKNKQGKVSDRQVYFILTGVLLCGFMADACGSHSLVGGFMFGLIIPKGELAIEIMERTEESVTGIMLPTFIITSGLRTNFVYLLIKAKWPYLVMISIIGSLAKIVSTVFVSSIFGMSLKEGLILGGLMNSKGVFALIVLNEGRNIKGLDVNYMVTMVLTVLLMTCSVGPMVVLINKTGKHSSQTKLKTIKATSPNSEFRILTCIHSIQNLSGIIRVLEISNATEKVPICVYAVHLVELTERASAMLVVHDKLKTNTLSRTTSSEKVHSDHIFDAFQSYKMGNESSFVHQLTVLSPYTTMHEDIAKLAQDRATTMILIPFHKQPTADGGFQCDNPSIKEVNRHLLAKSPCSVGILVDRGLGPTKQGKPVFGGRSPGLQLAMIFLGGPDDHEALSYAWRMAGKQSVTLTVVRFRQHQAQIMPENKDNDENDEDSVGTKKEFDDDYINEFRFKSMCDPSIIYHEKVVNNSEELEKTISEQYNNFDLYMVGRGLEVKTPLTKGLIDWGDSSTLGPIGDTLVSCKYTAHASLLVVQQSPFASDVSLQRSKSKFEQRKWASPVLNPEYEAIVNESIKG